jgi:hypothetical protein
MIGKILGPIIYALIWMQEVLLHSMGLPHLEASAVDPFVIKHTCDACCEWVVAKLTFT